MDDPLSQLKNGVALAELGGHGDGPYCAKHGAGAALVMLGTYIVDDSDDVPYSPDFVFKPGRHNYADYLHKHVAAARKSGAAVGVSVVSIDLDDTVDFLVAAEEARADYLSLCLHSTMEMFVSRGLSSALLHRENWPRLREHLQAILAATNQPFIAKIGLSDSADSEQALNVMGETGVEIVHANVGGAPSDSGLQAINRLSGSGLFLIIGGGINTPEEVCRVLEAGADAVAVGTAAMQDPDLCGRLQAATHERANSSANRR